MDVLVLAARGAPGASGALVDEERTARLVAAARRFSGVVDVLLPAEADDGAARMAADGLAALQGVRRVWLAADARLTGWLAEPLAALLADVVRRGGYARIIGDSSLAHRDVLARLAGLLQAPALTDVVDIIDANTVRRPMHAGDILATVGIRSELAVLLLRAVAFAPAEKIAEEAAAEVVAPEIPGNLPCPAELLEEEAGDSSGRPDLGRARIVLGMGRGAMDAESRALLLQLAEKLGAAVAATRAVVDEGLAPNDWQVGQTGKQIAPALYIAFGISGAHQHLAGIADAETIIAVNTDADAPIFAAADHGLAMDARKALKALLAELGEHVPDE